MSKKASRRRWRAFGSAFMLTLCLLILGAGCLVAEYNTRRTAFGDARIQMDYRIQDGKVTIRRNGLRPARLGGGLGRPGLDAAARPGARRRLVYRVGAGRLAPADSVGAGSAKRLGQGLSPLSAVKRSSVGKSPPRNHRLPKCPPLLVAKPARL